MDMQDLNIAYLLEPGIKARAPMEVAEDYIKCLSYYRKAIAMGYFTKLELAISLAQMKARIDSMNISTESNQLVDVRGVEDASRLLLVQQLGITFEDLDAIVQKVDDGLNKIRTEKAPKQNLKISC